MFLSFIFLDTRYKLFCIQYEYIRITINSYANILFLLQKKREVNLNILKSENLMDLKFIGPQELDTS